MDGRFLAFVAVSALLIVTPGPDMALVMLNALRGGRRAALLQSLAATTWWPEPGRRARAPGDDQGNEPGDDRSGCAVALERQ